MSRVLVAKPKLSLRERLSPLLRGLLRKSATTTLLVTHSFSDAWTLGDRIYILKDGKIIGGVSPEELAKHPLRHGAAELLGYYVLPARSIDNDKLVIDGLGVLKVSPPHGFSRGTLLKAAFRGDDIVVDPQVNTGNVLEGKIVDIVYTRFGVRIHVRIGKHLFIAETQRGILTLNRSIKTGEKVKVSIPPTVIDVAPIT